jgi:1,4-alpha-glucan branching enzyme
LWALEDRFWNVAPTALTVAEARPVLAQAARELLLAQASDWQFIITTGAVADYGAQRFSLHAADAELLVGLLEETVRGAVLPAQARRITEELQRRDTLFPDVLAQVAEVVERGRVGAAA